MNEFVTLRSLQRGRPEVWESLKKQNGRIILVNKGQPAYLLVDVTNQDIVPLVNMLDSYMKVGDNTTPISESEERTPASSTAV